MSSLYYCFFIMVCSITIYMASAAITTMSSDQLVEILKHQPISKKNNKLAIDFNLSPNQNYQITDTRRIKRNAEEIMLPIDIFKASTKRVPVHMKKNQDLIFEAVKGLIEKEKSRRQYDLQEPANSKYMKNEQELWNKLRIKAAGEVLLHPKQPFHMPTERIFNFMKADLEEASKETPDVQELFAPLKEKVEKEMYLVQFPPRGKSFMNTLRPF